MPNSDVTRSDSGDKFPVAAARDRDMASAAELLAALPAGVSWPVDDFPVGFLVLVDEEAVIANVRWTTLTGIEVEDSVGDGWWAAVHSEDRDDLAVAVRAAVDGDQVADWRVVGTCATWVRAHLRPTETGSRGTCLMAVTEIDPPDTGSAASTTCDSLTGLVDRATFMLEVTRSIDQVPAGGGPSAVLFIDLDHFKEVNDSYGHQVGDQVLVAACRRVRSVLRAGDLLGRLGGDELAVLIPTIDEPDEMFRLAERIVRVCDDAFTIDGEVVQIGASVGVALSDGDARTATALVDNADRAMYRAKAEGRGRWSVFAPTPGQHQRDHSLEVRVTLDQVGRSILQAKRHITALWRDVIDLRGDPFSTSLVDVSHALHSAALVLDRHATRFGSAPTRSSSLARAASMSQLIEAGSDAPDPGRASDAQLTTTAEGIMTAAGDPTRPEDLAAEYGSVTVDLAGDSVRVRMWGEHDLSTVGLLSTALVEAIVADDGDVVVDLSDVVFMDAATMGVLVRGNALLVSRDRHLTVRSPKFAQRRLLEICGLANLIEPTPAEELSQGQGAVTPLETWVEVPATPRTTESSLPAKAELARDDLERSRR